MRSNQRRLQFLDYCFEKIADDPNAPRVNNGISGDARRSSAELGKKVFDMKIDYAVKQIRSLVGGQ